MLDRLKSLPLTILLTVLIWMYAEAQFTATQDGLTLSLKAVAPAAGYSVRLIDPADARPRSSLPLTVTVQGPRAQIDKMRQQTLGLAAADEDLANLAYVLKPANLKVGSDSSLDTLTALNQLPYFKSKGLTVTAATPPRLRLDIDRLAKVSRPITFRSATLMPTDTPTLTPDRAEVTVPQQTLDAIGSEDRLAVVAVPERDLSTLPPDLQQSIPCRLIVEYPGPRDDRVTVKPQQIAVSLRIPRQRQDTLLIPNVPVWVTGAPAILARYDVDLSPKFVSLTVTGSPAALAAIRNALATATRPAPDLGVRAYIDITLHDLPTLTPEHRDLHYTLPPGVQLHEGPQHIDFRLVPRSPG